MLEVYYLCLALGYRGRYQVNDRAAVRALIETLQADLSAAAPAQGRLPARSDDRRESSRRSFRVSPLHIGMVAVVLISGIYLAAWNSAARTAARTSDALVGAIEERTRMVAPDRAPGRFEGRDGSAIEAAVDPVPAVPRSRRPATAGLPGVQ